MLRKLDSIKGCGIFADYKWDMSLNDLARINVIFGSNGTGKTSLSGALDGLRHPPEDEGYKKLSLTIEDGGITKTTAGADDSLFDRIHVFSERYVARSHIFTPAVAEMAAVLTIGEKSADAEKQLAEVKEALATKTMERDKAAIAETKASQAVETTYGNVSQQVFDAAGNAGGRWNSRSNFSARVVRTEFEKPDHSAWAELSEGELQQKIGIINASKAEALAEMSLTVTSPKGMEDRVAKALGVTPSTIVLDTLQLHPDAASWVDQGRNYHEGVDTCIFCGLPFTQERRNLIDQHFSDAVQRLQNELREVRNILSGIEAQVDTALRSIPDKGLFLEDLRARYDEPAQTLRAELEALNTWATGLKTRVDEKLANVLAVVDSGVENAPLVNGSEFLKLRGEHNQRVSQHDESVKAAAETVELHYLKRAEAEVAKQKVDAAAQKSAKDAFNLEIADLNTKISVLESVDGDPTPSAKVLTEEVSRLLGRSELAFTAVDGRYKVTRDGEPAIGLSMGERTAITLVHFLEDVARFDAGRGKPIVVIDDPVSSLDSEIFMGVSTYIWSEAIVKDHVAQLLLLTHNFELFRQWDIQIEALQRVKDKVSREKLSDKYPAEFYELKSTHVTKSGKTKRSPVIVGWPPSDLTRKKIRSTYHHAFIATAEKLKHLKVDDSLENRLDAQLLFPNVIRRILESFLAFKRPEWVGDFTNAMRNSADLLRENSYQGDADALRLRLTRYTHANSHNESPSTDITVSPDEVKTAIEAVFEFMNQIDTPHFKGLCEVTGVRPEDVLPTTPVVEGDVKNAEQTNNAI